MAAKRTSCRAQVETYGKTGGKMEALTAVQVGLLTIYDLCKAVGRGMAISGCWKSTAANRVGGR